VDDNQKQVFARRLYELRTEKKLTQQQLGLTLKIPRVSITKYETAERKPTINHLIQFGNFFDVPSDYLLGLSDVKSYDADLQAVCRCTGLSEEAVSTLNRFQKDYKSRAEIVNQLICDGTLHEMAKILLLLNDAETEEQAKYRKYDLMDFMVNLANRFIKK